MMNFAALFKAVDTLMMLREVAKKFTGAPPSGPPPDEALQTQAPIGQGLAGQIEARLTNVVVAALKEAFDRDHARLELERAQLEEERRRAEAALRLEQRRQAIDRELARLRLLAGGALLGWIASIAVFAAGGAGDAGLPRTVLAIGWLLLLGSLGAAFTAQGRIGAAGLDDGPGLQPAPEIRLKPGAPMLPASGTAAAAAALWLLIAGLAVTAVSVLL